MVADIGTYSVPFQFMSWLRRAKSKPMGLVLYRLAQASIGAIIFCLWMLIFGVPLNMLSGVFFAFFMVGATFGGAVRFAAWSSIYWPISAFIASIFTGQQFYSPSWWRQAGVVWSANNAVPWSWLGIGLLLAVVWVGVGRFASRGLGILAFNLVSKLTLREAQRAMFDRQVAEALEFEKSQVSSDEVHGLEVRTANDMDRRQLVYGVSGMGQPPKEEVSALPVQAPAAAATPAAKADDYSDLASAVSDADREEARKMNAGLALFHRT